jgi:Ankyrin repeats (many copies)
MWKPDCSCERFIEEDPGRQSISGSFNPIDEGEWAESAYVQATAKFFSSVSKNDTLAVIQIIEDGEELNRRDHVGRTPLHVAIMSNSVEVAAILIDAGARMTARLVGGRTAFHLAAQMGQPVLVGKMLARSAYNEKRAAEEKHKAKEAAKADSEDPGKAERVRMSNEDDWSSEESDDGQPPRKAPANVTKGKQIGMTPWRITKRKLTFWTSPSLIGTLASPLLVTLFSLARSKL